MQDSSIIAHIRDQVDDHPVLHELFMHEPKVDVSRAFDIYGQTGSAYQGEIFVSLSGVNKKDLFSAMKASDSMHLWDIFSLCHAVEYVNSQPSCYRYSTNMEPQTLVEKINNTDISDFIIENIIPQIKKMSSLIIEITESSLYQKSKEKESLLALEKLTEKGFLFAIDDIKYEYKKICSIVIF